MPTPPLSLARLLELSPADRLSFVARARSEIDTEIERLQAGEVRVWYGRSRSYHLQLLYARRQRLMVLAREVGCGDWNTDPIRAA